MNRILIHTLIVLMVVALSNQSLAQSGDRQNATRVFLRPELVDRRETIPAIIPNKSVKRPKVALVFSGGGARGIAGIGVLKALEDHHVPVDLLVGTSIGSIVGGLYAGGYSTEELEAIVKSTDWNDIINFGDESRRRELFLDQKLVKDRSSLLFRFSEFEPVIPSSFSSGQRLTGYLNMLTLQAVYHPRSSFDDLKIPFRAVATDLVSGKRIVLDRGDLAQTLRAGATVPLLFSPVIKDTMQLLDGGLLSNVAVDVARDLKADIVIAVDVTSPLRGVEDLNAPWEVADQIAGIMMQAANQEQLRNADVVIRPEIGSYLASDFSGLNFLIEEGEAKTLEMISKIKELIARKTSGSGGHSYPNPHIEYDATVVGAEWSKAIASLEGKPFLPEREALTLLGRMQESGDFSSVAMDVTEADSATYCRLLAVPYPVLSKVQFVGNSILEDDTLRQVFDPLLGKPLNSVKSAKAMEEIIRLYRARGYSLAKIASVEFDKEQGVAAITIDEGVIHRREIRGTVKTKDYVLWREMPLRANNVFTIHEASESMTNLHSTNLFEHILLSVYEEPIGGGRTGHIVRVTARERPTELIRLSLRIDNERHVQPSIDIRDENFLGIGSELGLTAIGGLRNRSYVTEFRARRIFNSYFTFGLKAYYSVRDAHAYGSEQILDPTRWNRVRIGEFREVKQGGSATFGTQLERLGTVTVEGRLEHHRYWNIIDQPLTPEQYRIASFKVGTQIDTRDEFPFPTDGISLNLFYESAVVRIKDGIGFSKLFLSYEDYRQIARRHVVGTRFILGSADATLPFTEQFTLGGQHSFYGLREDDSRGRQLFVASVEYRYQIPFKAFLDTYFKARYDFGSIWEIPEQIRLRDLRHGIGLGLALDTPLGLAELSAGRSFYFRKDILDRPLSLGPLVLYFTIGYSL
jgi:NTE family protein